MIFEVICKRNFETKAGTLAYKGDILKVYAINDVLFLVYLGASWQWVNCANFEPYED